MYVLNQLLYFLNLFKFFDVFLLNGVNYFILLCYLIFKGKDDKEVNNIESNKGTQYKEQNENSFSFGWIVYSNLKATTRPKNKSQYVDH